MNTKKRDLLSSRRRVEDEGDNDEGPEDLGDDSQSEASILTMDDNGAADESDLSEISKSEAALPVAATGVDGSSLPADKKQQNALLTNGAAVDDQLKPVFSQSADVEALVDCLKIENISAYEEALEFEDSTDQLKPVGAVATSHERSAALAGHRSGRGGRQQTRGAGFKSVANAANGHRTGQAIAVPQGGTDEGITTDKPQSTPSHSLGRGAIRGRGFGKINNGSFQYISHAPSIKIFTTKSMLIVMLGNHYPHMRLLAMPNGATTCMKQSKQHHYHDHHK